MYQYAIETNGLTKQYEEHVCVDHLDLQIEQGKIYGLLGRNGAGKTTTIRMIMGLIRPTSGFIKMFGKENASDKSRLYTRIGSIIETPGFYENLTGYENLDILARLRKIPGKSMVEEALSLVGLDREPGKVVGHYSLGMKQRLGIAAAIMHNPELLILDEPINGLDPIGIHEIRKFLDRLRQEKGVTILISSHILNEVEQLADVIGVIHEGKLLEEIDMDELRKSSCQYIEFGVSDQQKAGRLLQENFQIGEFSFHEHGCLRIHSNFGQQDSFNKVFVEHDIAVSKIQVYEENLEEYFVRKIGGGIIG